MNKRFDHVWQIALGLVLYRWQVSHGSHFHWEQPGGSDMFKFPELEELQQFCERCRFDLCRVGKPSGSEVAGTNSETTASADNFQ